MKNKKMITKASCQLHKGQRQKAPTRSSLVRSAARATAASQIVTPHKKISKYIVRFYTNHILD